MNFKDYINNIQNFPRRGILYRDIQPLLANNVVFERAIKEMLKLIDINNVDYFIGIESRGFIFSSTLALKASIGNKLIRKKGKLPNNSLVSLKYSTEYSEDNIELQIGHGSVIIVDDIYATGGTINAAIKLAEKAGYQVLDTVCLLDVGIIKKHNTKCLISY